MSLPTGSVIYQGYPLTLADGNGDGIGDFVGIEHDRLPYLKNELGVDGLWLSPFYDSPWKDGGYDVANYTRPHPMHGTLEEAESMLRTAGRLGIDVIADFVPSHSSDQHPEFQRALRDPANTSYIFRDPLPDGSPPNNWRSVFPKQVCDPQTGKTHMKPDSAWRKVRDHWPHAAPERLDQYCLTNFATYQPNWNHANPSVRKHLQDAARFWLERGVSGFRFDAVDYMDHDRQYRNEPLNPSYKAGGNPYDELRRVYSTRGPHSLSYLKDLVSVIEDFPKAYAMLESYPDRDSPRDNPVEHYMKYYHAMDGSLSGRAAPFCFEITDLPWDAQKFKASIDAFQAALRPQDVAIYPGGNHDKDRLATRYGSRAARAAAVMQLALPGIALVFQGDELGMTNHDGIPYEKRTDTYLNRDVARTPLPMHAKDTRAGFSTADPEDFRLPIHPDYRQFNVRTQQQDPNSSWNTYARSIALRKRSPALHNGGYAPVNSGNAQTFAFMRIGENRGDHYMTVVNFADEATQINLEHVAGIGDVVLSSQGVVQPDKSFTALQSLTLRPHEAVVVRPRS